MDIQRTILWGIFLMSVLVLWDKWQVSQGRPSLMGSLFGTQPVAEKKVDAPTAPVAPGQIGAVIGWADTQRGKRKSIACCAAACLSICSP